MKIEIKTPTGYQDFDGIKRYWHNEYLQFTFNDDSIVECAFKHKFIINNEEVFADTLNVGDFIGKTIKHIKEINEGDYFFDPVNVKNGSVYCHDENFVSHNTFYGTGNTLIRGDILLNLKATTPVKIDGDVNVYFDPIENHDYIMTVDVAKGRGQDYTTFNIIDITEQPFKQVATYRNNLISPLLIANILFKWATTYNSAYVIVENNDQGIVVANGLYYDLEYENTHVESMIKAGSIGVTMNRKVKRIGCSNLKDLIEGHELELYDLETISECSTFESRGDSFEASDGNHDDLVMNLVLFAWYVGTDLFINETDVSIKQRLFEEQIKMIEEELTPFGEVDDGLNEHEVIRNGGFVWEEQPFKYYS